MEKPVLHSNELVTLKTRQAVADVLNLPAESIEGKSVNGGYSRNRRALLGSGDTWAFVKEVDIDHLPDEGEEELWWLQKDYLCVEALREKVPELVPAWSRLQANGHALIMTSYPSDEGWLWSPPEDPEIQQQYVQAVVDAVKRLETVRFDEATIEYLKLQPYFRDKLAYDDGFEMVVRNAAIREQLREKYHSLALHPGPLQERYGQLLAMLNDDNLLKEISDDAASLLTQPNDVFGHCDVRSDNVAFHPDTNELKIVDWNWASYTPKGFGATEFLTDMSRRGIDVTPWISELNPQLLAATVGFYMKRCLMDPLFPGSTLRDMQAESAAVAYDLYLRSTKQQAR